MTTLTKVQVERAEKLRAEGKSLRKTAAALGVAASTVKRAFDQQKESGKNSTLEQIRKQRLIRLKHQNSKLALEVRKLKAQVVDGEKMKREVLDCNSIVKLQVLSAPIRVGPQLGLTQEQIAGLSQAIVEACNDLAFERERPPKNCPTCGERIREDTTHADPREDRAE